MSCSCRFRDDLATQHVPKLLMDSTSAEAPIIIIKTRGCVLNLSVFAVTFLIVSSDVASYQQSYS